MLSVCPSDAAVCVQADLCLTCFLHPMCSHTHTQNHFENEIASCRGFQSKVQEEAVALMPEAEFLASPSGQDHLQKQASREQQGEGHCCMSNVSISSLHCVVLLE